MKPTLVRIWIMPFVLALAAVQGQSQQGSVAELPKITGTWDVVGGEIEGQRLDEGKLAGTRIVVDGKTVVALVYQRNKHPINLFITPAPTSRSTSPKVMTRRGYNVFSWTNNGMKYWAVSDLNQAELSKFTELVRAVK